MITSKHNPKIKRALKLHGNRGRKQEGLILIDGIREITRALDGGVKAVEALVSANLATSEARGPAERLADATSLIRVEPQLFRSICYGDRSDGVVLVAERPATELSAWNPGPNELVAVVEAAEKPGNLGAIIRTADAAGATAVIAADPVCDVFHPNAVRASMGLCFRMPIFRAESAEAGEMLQKSGFGVFAAIAQEAKDYRTVDFPQRSAIVLGSEARGLTDFWRSPPVTPITIPMHGAADSLNLSAAAAVLLFQAAAARSD